MDKILKILGFIANILKLWFSKNLEEVKNEREIRKDNKELSNKLENEIQDAVNAIESDDVDKLNKILK